MSARDGGVSEGFWVNDSRELDDYLSQDEGFGGQTYPGLVSLSFIRSAIKRTAKVWCMLAFVGLVVGVGLYVARPAGYQATTSVIMAQPPGAPLGWITDDQAIAQSRTVAGMALRKLGLHESVASFVRAYTVVATTNRILVLTVKATSARDALREANALRVAFLSFQASLLTKQEKLVDTALQQQVTSAKLQLAAINAQITKLQSEPPSTAQQQQLHDLQNKRDQADGALTQLKQTVTAAEANTAFATATAIKNSDRLDPAALVPQSVKRHLALYGGGGLIGGLVIGLGIVIVTAVVSTKLRRRDDVASALAAPVRLSIRKRRVSRRRLRQQGLAAAQDRDLARVTTHLATAVAPATAGFASLAVVAVDDAEVAAVCLASMALSSAQEGFQVVLADLCDGAPGARLLGVTSRGIEQVTVGAARLAVVVPDPADVPPAGPSQANRTGRGPRDPLLAVCASADLVLTLATLDPALGSDQLAEWASSAVVVVTAGRSSAERIHAVGEMIRLAGIRQITAVLVGADKSDESLGMPRGHVVTPSGPVSEETGPIRTESSPHGAGWGAAACAPTAKVQPSPDSR